MIAAFLPSPFFPPEARQRKEVALQQFRYELKARSTNLHNLMTFFTLGLAKTEIENITEGSRSQVLEST